MCSTSCFFTGNYSFTQLNIREKVEGQMKKDFQSIWLQRPDRWDFFGSLFFCCTVFTTVGKLSYLQIYIRNQPVQHPLTKENIQCVWEWMHFQLQQCRDEMCDIHVMYFSLIFYKNTTVSKNLNLTIVLNEMGWIMGYVILTNSGHTSSSNQIVLSKHLII